MNKKIKITYIKNYCAEISNCAQNEIWKLICESDGEFIPPLSSRENTTQKDLISQQKSISPNKYYGSLLEQEWLVAEIDNEIVGFMSFRRDTDNVVYISTIIISQRHRCQGICKSLYEFLEQQEIGKTLRTRTWSTNYAHINRLKKQGFNCVETIENDRGEGIDTVYYEKFAIGV